MRKSTFFKSLLLLCAIIVGSSSARADVSTLTFTAACGGSGTADDGAVWTVTSDGDESVFDATKGIHYGTGSKAVQYITLTTSGISGTITKVVVNASTANGVSATASVTVGGEAFGGDAQALTSSAAEYTFNGSANGEIVVTVTKPAQAVKALYVKSITVTYTSGGGTGEDTREDTEIILAEGYSEEIYADEEVVSPSLAAVYAGKTDIDRATVTWESSDASVATIDAATGAITLVGAGTTTIKASYAGDETNYKPSTKTYTLKVYGCYDGIAALQKAVTSAEAKVKVTFTDAIVTAVKGKNAYLVEGENGLIIYTDGHGLEAGKVINGTLKDAILVLYKGATEIKNFSSDDLTITDGTVPEAVVKTIDELSANNMGLIVKIEAVSYNATKKVFSDGTNEIAFQDAFSASPEIEEGKTYNVTGMVNYYDKLQISPLEASGVEEITDKENPVSAWKLDGKEINSICVVKGDAVGATFETNSTGETTFATSNEEIATVDKDGNIRQTGTRGMAIVTATTAANDSYYSSNTPLYVIVGEEIVDGVFTFKNFQDYGSGIIPGDNYYTEEATWTAGNITLKTSGKYRWYIASTGDPDFRLYSGVTSTLTFSAPDGYVITSVAGLKKDVIFFGDEALTSNTWTGMAQSVTFTAESSVTLTTLTVTYSPITVPVTLDDNYTSYCNASPVSFRGTDVKVYKAKVDEGKVVLTEISDGRIPAGAGVILKADAGDYSATVVEPLADLEENELKGVTADKKVSYKASDTYNYILQGGVFKKATGAKLKAGKAYLSTSFDVTTTSGDEARLEIVIAGETTGISTLLNDTDNRIFDLQGRRVAQPTKGLYIKSGRKVLVK